MLVDLFGQEPVFNATSAAASRPEHLLRRNQPKAERGAFNARSRWGARCTFHRFGAAEGIDLT
ncbi:MAG TPA: hypothetical protein VIV60_23120, partial [Polyangiaceae bacterium]